MPWPYAIVACSIGFHDFDRTQPARDLAGKSGLRRRAETRFREHLPHRLRRQRRARSSRRPRCDDFWITCSTVSAPCACASWIVAVPIVSEPGAVWITVSGRIGPASSAAAIVNGFSVEPGSNTSVSARLRIRSRATLSRAVRVVRRPVREREDLAGLHVEDDEAAGLGLVQVDRGLELAEREVLQPRVERERQVAARLRRADRRDVLDRLVAPVDDDAAAARRAGQPRLLRELDALLARRRGRR